MSDDTYVDDATIGDADRLLRRIYRGWWTRDKNLGRVRPSSQAFKDHPNGSPMSVHLAKVLEDYGLAVETVLSGHSGFALASITAGLARECEQGIARTPLEDDPAHAEVFGPKTKSVRNKLAKKATWVVPPDHDPAE